jgi:ABC-type enterochelin transport system permease subunit
MLLAVACMGLFVALDIAVTWTAYSVLIASGTGYAAATSDATKAALAASAAYPSAILDSPLPGTCAIVIPSLGILLAGLVMLRGVFNKPTAYLALATGVTAFAFMGSYVVEALSPLRIVNALLVTVWYALAGIRLYRLGQR